MSAGLSSGSASLAAGTAARRAEALGGRLPPLLVAAERVAATVAQGVHGRRRVGQGDSFWQYRPFLPGDSAGSIDWRQSARSDRAFVRETEWEAAQSVYLWRDGGASMRWRSREVATDKIDRAGLLLLALAALLLRGGERVRLLGGDLRAAGGGAAGGLERMAAQLDRMAAGDGLPPEAPLPRHSRVVLIGDMLAPLGALQAAIGRLAGIPVTGHVLQVLDPAEASLPYAGRVRFHDVGDSGTPVQALIPRVEAVRGDYVARLAEQQHGLSAICRAAGWGFAVHQTDHPAEAALLGLYAALSPLPGRR